MKERLAELLKTLLGARECCVCGAWFGIRVPYHGDLSKLACIDCEFADG